MMNFRRILLQNISEPFYFSYTLNYILLFILPSIKTVYKNHSQYLKLRQLFLFESLYLYSLTLHEYIIDSKLLSKQNKDKQARYSMILFSSLSSIQRLNGSKISKARSLYSYQQFIFIINIHQMLVKGYNQFTLHLLLFCFFIFQSKAIFCSAYCKPNFCTGLLPTQCTDCDPPFMLLSGSCIIDPNSGYAIIQDSSQISVLPTPGNTNCGVYTFKGFTVNDRPRLRSSNTINVPHYQVRLISWVILYNQWATTDLMYGQLNTTSEIKSQSVTTYSTAQLLCSWSTANQWYLKLDLSFTHNTLTDIFSIDVYTTDIQMEPWGMKQYMFLVAKCHVACLVCTDATPYSCSSCQIGFKLSGTTCNQTCLYKYGEVSGSNICVSCDILCITCYNSAINCSTCQINSTTPAYFHFLTCVLDCPAYYTQQTLNYTCIRCDDFVCLNCQVNFPVVCLQCDVGYYWFNFTCISICPDGYYANSPNCTNCDISCQLCTGSPSPCSYCSLNYYLYLTSCLLDCPTGYFKFNQTRLCLNCAIDCVTAIISLSVSSDNSKLIATITFSKQIDFLDFPKQNFQFISTNDSLLSLDNFIIVYSVVDLYTYTISLQPKQMINMTYTNFTLTIRNQTNIFYSINGYPFNDNIFSLTTWTIWNLVIYPSMEDQQKAIISILQEINNQINNVFGSIYFQEIKKTGIFAFLLSGCQLPSTVVLHNTIAAENFYQIARFWASFVYFQVPRWEQGPNITKYLAYKQVEQISSTQQYFLSKSSLPLYRLLQTSTQVSNNWRFYRTGFTNFILFDCYMLIGLLIICWVLLIIPRACYWRLNVNKRSIFYNIFHIFHEMSLFYFVLSICLQLVTFQKKLENPSFDNDSVYIFSSFGVSIFIALYFLIYQVYVYYQLLSFGLSKTGSTDFRNYIQKYSFFLRDIRYQQYKNDLTWSPKHMLRPYNYRILSCLRLSILLIALPIFHDFPLVSILVVVCIQLLQIIRFIFTWPFNHGCYNIAKLLLQICLLLTFIAYGGTYLMIEYIYNNLNTTPKSYVRTYYIIGWVGGGLTIIYNLGYIIWGIKQMWLSCKYTNQQRMEESRKLFYFQMLQDYEQKAILSMMKIQRAKQSNSMSQKKDIPQSLKGLNREFKKQLELNKEKVTSSEIQDSGKEESKDPFLDFLYNIHDANKKSLHFKENEKKKQLEDIIRKGNLTNLTYQNMKTQKVKIQQYEIRYAYTENKYQVKIFKVPGVFMRTKVHPTCENNILVPVKQTKEVVLSLHNPSQYFQIINQLFNSYASITTQSISITTYLTVNQNLYQPGQQIPQKKQNLSQWIEIRQHNGSVARQKVKQILSGFPISVQMIKQL